VSFCLAEGVLTQKLGPELVLMHVAKGQYYELNSTGAVVLEAILAGADEPSAAQQLSQRFQVDLDRAHADVSALIKNLTDRALLMLQ
jgi:hypothetical protein